MQWLQRYPDFNQKNLKDEPYVLRFGDSGYYFVHQNHPVIDHLYKGQNAMGMLTPIQRDKVNVVTPLPLSSTHVHCFVLRDAENMFQCNDAVCRTGTE